MTDLRKAAEMALEALGETIDYLPAKSGVRREVDDSTQALRQALAQPEQEPVAWYGVDDYDKKYLGWDKHDLLDEGFAWITPLYTAPPKREWVGLTDEEIDIVFDKHFNRYAERNEAWPLYERELEAKLKEKNT